MNYHSSKSLLSLGQGRAHLFLSISPSYARNRLAQLKQSQYVAPLYTCSASPGSRPRRGSLLRSWTAVWSPRCGPQPALRLRQTSWPTDERRFVCLALGYARTHAWPLLPPLNTKRAGSFSSHNRYRHARCKREATSRRSLRISTGKTFISGAGRVPMQRWGRGKGR